MDTTQGHLDSPDALLVRRRNPSFFDSGPEYGIDTIRLHVPVSCWNPGRWVAHTAYRKNGEIYGKSLDSYGKNPARLYCEWCPGKGYFLEGSTPHLLGLDPTSLADADQLLAVCALLERYLERVKDPNHILPPSDSWSFTRTDLAMQFAASQTSRLADYFIAGDPSATYMAVNGPHCSASKVGTTYTTRLYDKLAERGIKRTDSITLMRLEVSIRRNGLCRKAWPYERNLAGITELVRHGIPRLLEPEIAQVNRALVLLDAENHFPHVLSLCRDADERTIVRLLLQTFPRDSMRESLRIMRKDRFTPEVWAFLRSLAKLEGRKFRPQRSLPDWAK